MKKLQARQNTFTTKTYLTAPLFPLPAAKWTKKQIELSLEIR